MKADGTKGKGEKRCTGKEKMHKEWNQKKRKQTGSVYRIVKSSTIYTASFKTQMFSTI